MEEYRLGYVPEAKIFLQTSVEEIDVVAVHEVLAIHESNLFKD